MLQLSRRDVLRLAVVLPFPLRASSRQVTDPAVSVGDFVRLSERLTGHTRLDAGVAAVYLKALMAEPANRPLLAVLVQGGPSSEPALAALERTILEWWYTGTYLVRGEARLATHTGALMWSALGMPAPGTCAAPFGAWARPPRASG